MVMSGLYCFFLGFPGASIEISGNHGKAQAGHKETVLAMHIRIHKSQYFFFHCGLLFSVSVLSIYLLCVDGCDVGSDADQEQRSGEETHNPYP